MFLAMWHGLWPGYFITFLLEFILVVQERQVNIYNYSCNCNVFSFQLFSWLKHVTRCQSLNDLPLVLSAPLILVALLLKSIVICFPLAFFALLTWEDCWKVCRLQKMLWLFVLYTIVYDCSKVLLIHWNLWLGHFQCSCCPKHDEKKIRERKIAATFIK